MWDNMRKKYPYLEESYTPFSKTPQDIEKNYPYVESPYNYNLNKEQEKEDFLAKIDSLIVQKQYVNITLLDWQENPIKEIQGVISSGSITKDGKSSVRRSANLSCSVSYGEYDVDNLEMDFALNKKVFIEIGVENKTDEYPEYPILWFPQGVFYINSFNMNASTSSAVNLTLNLKDKMCLLNGDVGGKLPATIQFDTMTTQAADGSMVDQKVLYYNIIMELLQHWGNEDLNNIIIQDVPLRITKIMQWNGDQNIYLYKDENDYYQYTLEEPENKEGYTEYARGDDIGYVYADFVPTGEITCAAGDTVCKVLDTIKNQLGNYEYFYDVFGIFHFREIKNYLNINQSEIMLQETENPGRYISLEKGQFNLDTSTELQYLVDITNDKTSFSFEDAKNIISITVTPNYNNIKNDIIINGIRKTTAIQVPIRYRLAIDNKPEIVGYTTKEHDAIAAYGDPEKVPYYGVFHNLLYYTNPEYYNGEGWGTMNVLGKWISVETLPAVGNMDRVYWAEDEQKFYIYTGVDWAPAYLEDETQEPIVYNDYYATDWRTFLLCYGLEATANGTDPGAYYSDLVSFWPAEYDLRRENQKFFGEEEDQSIHYKSLTTGNYYFDIIDANSSSLGMYSVENIGRRTEIVNDNNVNCLFAPEIPNVVFLNADNPAENWSDNTTITEIRPTIDNIHILLQEQVEECINNGQPWLTVGENIFNNLIVGGYLNGAYDAIKYALFSHTTYQKTLSISAIPAFYLEPNSRVYVSNVSTNTFGDYMVQSVNLTLGANANMSTSLSEVSERL